MWAAMAKFQCEWISLCVRNICAAASEEERGPQENMLQ